MTNYKGTVITRHVPAPIGAHQLPPYYCVGTSFVDRLDGKTERVLFRTLAEAKAFVDSKYKGVSP